MVAVVGWYLARSLPLIGLATLLALLIAFSLPANAQQQVINCASNVAHSSTACEIAPAGVSTAAESGHVVKTGAGILISANLNNWGASAGVTVMALDANAVPANGVLSVCSGVANASPCILKWFGIPSAPSASAPSTSNISWPGPFMHFLVGLVFVCSSTGPTTLTLTDECTFSSEVQ
jgi:hypothetical protein